MTLVALGLNHTTAPVAVRERVSINPDELSRALQDLLTCDGVEEAAIVSTCNRTDLYCGMSEARAAVLGEWLRKFHQLDDAEIDEFLYSHQAESAVRHLMRTASGLDSMVLGEPQILGQVKTAYAAAVASGSLGTVLDRLFQHSFAVAKRVRTDTAIGSSPVSVAFAAVSLARQIFSSFEEQTALFLGAGETIELAARHLHANGLGRMIVANRTLANAQRLADEFDGYAIGLDNISAHLAEADIVIASTGSPEPILDRDTVAAAIDARKRRPIFMVDIAVPQDIDPAVGELPDVYLYSIDDLQEIIAENRRSRQEAADEAESIIETEVHEFMGWLGTRRVIDTIRALRRHSEETRDEVLARAKRMVSAGDDPAHALEYLAQTLTNKLLHSPTAQVRAAGASGHHEVVEAARALFPIDDAATGAGTGATPSPADGKSS